MSALIAPAIFAGGILQAGSGPITNRAGAKGYNSSGALVFGTGPVAAYVHGIPFNAAGEIVVGAATAPFSYSQGLKYNSSGAIVAVASGSAVAPLYASNGMIFDSNGALVGSTGGVAADTWDPANKGADWTLSNGNKTATGANQNGNWVVSATSKSAGKVYFEVKVDTLNSTFDYVGLVIAAKNTGNTGVQGNTTEMVWKASGSFSVGGGTNPPSYITGDVLGFAWDFATKRLTTYKNGVQQGLSPVSGMVGALRIGATNTFGASPNVFTLRTTTSEFTQSVPAGYTAWAEAS